jgi:hypothetical protein
LDLAQAIAQKIEAEHRQHQGGTGKERDPPFAGLDEVRALGDHDAPFGIGRPHAQANEGEAGGVQDGVAHGERHLHHHDGHDVGQDVAQQHARLAVAGKARRLDEACLAAHIGLGARHTGIERKVDDGGGDHDVDHLVAERRHDAHGEHE